AHYRTSPLDLRRMMDAPGQHFLQATANNRVAGALWLVEEGGLSAELSQAVWCGFRRPRGNLVAQSLAAHGSDPLAATLVGRRVSRIAVHPARQR
ncbi:GNAT family N-acetyltransferase, partial [Salmonella enterica]